MHFQLLWATCRYDRHEPGLLRPWQPLGGHRICRGEGGPLKQSLQHSDGKDGQWVVPADLGHDWDQHAEHPADKGAYAEHPLAAKSLRQVSPKELCEDVADGEAGQEEPLFFCRPGELSSVICRTV